MCCEYFTKFVPCNSDIFRPAKILHFTFLCSSFFLWLLTSDSATFWVCHLVSLSHSFLLCKRGHGVGAGSRRGSGPEPV